MSDCTSCCCFLTIFLGICYFLLNGSAFYYYLFHAVRLIFWGILYIAGIGGYIWLFYMMIMLMHTARINILEVKKEGRIFNNYRELNDNLNKLGLNILGNVLFIAFSFGLLYYFEHWFFKYPLIFFICTILGYASSFPLSNEEEQKLIDYKSEAMDNIRLRTGCNLCAFAALYIIYSNFDIIKKLIV
jgi:hypothetical protein